MSIPERDWRLLRSAQSAALERYCTRVLDECATAIRGAEPAHDRYLRLFRLLQERNAAMAAAFDDLRRSTAIQRLAVMIALGAVTDAELDLFSAPTREAAKALAEMYSAPNETSE